MNDAENHGKVPSAILPIRKQQLPFPGYARLTNNQTNPNVVPAYFGKYHYYLLRAAEGNCTRQASLLCESLRMARKSALRGVDFQGRGSVSNLCRLLISASGRALGSLYANTGFAVEKANKEV